MLDDPCAITDLIDAYESATRLMHRLNLLHGSSMVSLPHNSADLVLFKKAIVVKEIVIDIVSFI